jgi:hypothetical protein
MINVIPRFKIQNRALSPFRSKKVPRKESEKKSRADSALRDSGINFYVSSSKLSFAQNFPTTRQTIAPFAC